MKSLLALPQRSVCEGTFETEGTDYDVNSGALRVEMAGMAAMSWSFATHRGGTSEL